MIKPRIDSPAIQRETACVYEGKNGSTLAARLDTSRVSCYKVIPLNPETLAHFQERNPLDVYQGALLLDCNIGDAICCAASMVANGVAIHYQGRVWEGAADADELYSEGV